MKTQNSKFQKGSGVYQCRDCKKMTRETGDGESSVDLCSACYEDAGNENMEADASENLSFDASVAGFTPAEFASMDPDEQDESVEELENRVRDLLAVISKLKA